MSVFEDKSPQILEHGLCSGDRCCRIDMHLARSIRESAVCLASLGATYSDFTQQETEKEIICRAIRQGMVFR